MWENSNPVSSGVVGYGYVLSVCTPYRYIIMEDVGGFTYLSVASHEIGHNLGAFHDGSSKTPECLSSTGNLMSAFLQIFINKFSSCSIKDFKSHLLKPQLE